MIPKIKRHVKSVFQRLPFRRPCAYFVTANELFPQIFVETDSHVLRNMLLLPADTSKTQLNQDIFALLVNKFEKGFFLEIGANDGYNLSNTLYLENCFGWDGLLIEANPRYTDSLMKRKARHVLIAVADKDCEVNFYDADLYGGISSKMCQSHSGKYLQSALIKVSGKKLESILIDSMAPSYIDFVSIDIEGAEIDVINQICESSAYRFGCGCVEYNGRINDYNAMKHKLASAGYIVVWEGKSGHDLFFIDHDLIDANAN